MSQHNSINFGKEISLTIDGKVCRSTFGKTILEVARANDIYIPTMCHLTKVKPIASCRMCIVDVEGVDGAILSCQEKATDGAVVVTQNSQLYTERQNIMKLYNVNHPLECGVCDQSGECDLQNKTMEFDVEEQPFTTKEPHRPVQNWGHVSYDPALCIMCEKCVRVSTEITGDEALELKFGGYSSTIVNTKKDKNYASLGEAAAVCPVGALVDTHFKYTTNAWELEQVPSSCTHCSAGCEMRYDVKHDTIYRVTNNYEFSSLCGAGRYGFDYANKSVVKDKKAFDKAVECLKSSQNLLFTTSITNEEASILQKIKEKTGIKLVCDEARHYQSFLKSYAEVTGEHLYGGSLEQLSNSKGVIVLGSRVNDDAPSVKYHINMASKWHRARVIYLHPLEDKEIQTMVTQFIKYEAGTEESVAGMLVEMLVRDVTLPKEVRTFIESLDIGNLSGMSNVSEEEIEILRKSLMKKSEFSLVIGSDIYAHPNASNIAKVLALLEKYANFNVICIPPSSNALGVSLICDLDKKIEGKTVGYNVQADFVLSALGAKDENSLDMPALNQQEGTITSLDKKVLPLNVAQSYGGYILNDLAESLGIYEKYTIDYTEQLPQNKGFKAEKFDTLPNYFDITGKEYRGYELARCSVEIDETLEDVEELSGFDGVVIYTVNPIEQFSAFTAMCEPLKKDVFLVGSEQFAQAFKLKDGENISFSIDGITFNRMFKIDTSMRGTIALNPTFDMGLSAPLVSSYRFNRVEIKRVGS